jgi:hypothetical protein
MIEEELKQAIMSKLVIVNKESIDKYAIPELLKIINKYYDKKP